MSPEEKFNEMALAAKGAIEDFRDFADDRALSWAHDTIKALRSQLTELEQCEDCNAHPWCVQKRGECDGPHKAETSDPQTRLQSALAQGRKEGMEEAARIAENICKYLSCTRDDHGIPAAIRVAIPPPAGEESEWDDKEDASTWRIVRRLPSGSIYKTPSAGEECCEWEMVVPGQKLCAAGCGKYGYATNFLNEHMKFCPYCGKSIKIKESP